MSAPVEKSVQKSAQGQARDSATATELCRYCLMCRHVCPVTAVTGSEATSPHGWGTLIASVSRGLAEWNEDTVDVLYQCADCGLCRAHCVTDQPLPLAIALRRAEVVEQKQAPQIVYQLAERLDRWSNVHAETDPEEVSGSGEAALIVGASGHHLEPAAALAAIELLAAAGVSAVPVAIGRESPHLPHSLGLPAAARKLARATLDEIRGTGAHRVFVLSPGDRYAYGFLSRHLGLDWPQEVELSEVTSHLAESAGSGRLELEPTELGSFAFFDPDHTVRVPGRWEAPRKLLERISGTPPLELFWRQERAWPSGTGALCFTHPGLAAGLAQSRLVEAAERGVERLFTDDPLTLHHLRRQSEGTGVAVEGLYELLQEQLRERLSL